MTGADLLAGMKRQPIACVCGALIVAGGLAIYFRGDSLDQLRVEFEAKDKESQKIALNIRNSVGFPEQTQELQAASKQLESRLLRVGDLANNLQFFYRLENATGVKLVDVRQMPIPPVKAGAPKPLYTAVPFSVTVGGSYAQIYTFLRHLETAPHFVRIERLAVTKSSAPQGESAAAAADVPALTASLTVEILGTP